jgi:riboflavin kinase
MASLELSGRLASGEGVARHYTREAWARDAFMKAAGIDPFPGTLNVLIPDGPDRQSWLEARVTEGIVLPAPTPEFCDGRLFHAIVTSMAGHSAKGAVVVPMVPGYPEDRVEVIADIGLREAFGIVDGDVLTVRIEMA